MTHETDPHEGIRVQLEYISKGVDELRQLQQTANGRIGKAETRIAVLEDRSPGRAATVWGSVSGGIAGGVVMAIKALFGGGQ